MTTIDNNVAMPEEAPKEKKPRKRAVKKEVPAENPAASLIAALNFIAIAQQKEGTPYQTHCKLNQNWVMAFNGVVSLGAPIIEDLQACPNTLQLQHALTKCGKSLSITQLSPGQLRVASERFKATIDCIPLDQADAGWPDPCIAPLSNEVRTALEALAWVATEGADRAFQGAVMLQANTAVATNGHVMLEYWHGNNLPPDLLIPKSSITALLKTDKKITGFGYTVNNSATFWFEDGCYFKTQLFNDKFPAYSQIFDRMMDIPISAIHPEFFTALQAVAPFSKNKFVFLKTDKLCSERDEELGASYDLAGLPSGHAFNCEYLKHCAPWFENVKFATGQVSFSKASLRGAIAAGNPSV